MDKILRDIGGLHDVLCRRAGGSALLRQMSLVWLPAHHFLPTLHSTAKCFPTPLALDTHDPLFTVKPGVEIQDSLIHRQMVVNLNITSSAPFLNSQLLLKVLAVQQPLVKSLFPNHKGTPKF